MLKDRNAIQIEIEKVIERVKEIGQEWDSLQVELSSIDKQLADLKTRRSSVSERVAVLDWERASLKEKEEDLRSQLLAALTPEEFMYQLVELAGPYLGAKSVSELNEIRSSLAPFEPVVVDGDSPFVDGGVVQCGDETGLNADVSGVVTGEGLMAGQVVMEHFEEPKLPGNAGKSMQTFFNVCKDIGIPYEGGEFRLYLSDIAKMVDVMKRCKTILKNFKYKLHLNGKVFEFDRDYMIPRIKSTGKYTTQLRECVRMLYYYAFIQWLKMNDADMSARSVMDYLICERYTEHGGVVYSALYDSSYGLFYYCIEDKDGNIVRETEITTRPDNRFVIYTDDEGYSVVTGMTGRTSSYANVLKECLPCYFGYRLRVAWQDKCVGIKWPDIFGDAYITFEEAEYDG